MEIFYLSRNRKGNREKAKKEKEKINFIFLIPFFYFFKNLYISKYTYISMVLEVEKGNYIKILTQIKKDLLEESIKILTKKYGNPNRKFYILLNEALEEYINRHLSEIEETKK
jgi:hypothetical protein